ncbi:hypothetical protein RYX36_029734, partial [Vicia faba]
MKDIGFTGLDVIRTDRTLVFYQKKESLSKLWDILAVYVRIDNGQEMSDLCSPMIILLDDEVNAFWCFERLLHRLQSCSTNSSITKEQYLSDRIVMQALQEAEDVIEVESRKEGKVELGVY